MFESVCEVYDKNPGKFVAETQCRNCRVARVKGCTSKGLRRKAEFSCLLFHDVKIIMLAAKKKLNCM